MCESQIREGGSGYGIVHKGKGFGGQSGGWARARKDQSVRFRVGEGALG